MVLDDNRIQTGIAYGKVCLLVAPIDWKLRHDIT